LGVPCLTWFGHPCLRVTHHSLCHGTQIAADLESWDTATTFENEDRTDALVFEDEEVEISYQTDCSRNVVPVPWSTSHDAVEAHGEPAHQPRRCTAAQEGKQEQVATAHLAPVTNGVQWRPRDISTSAQDHLGPSRMYPPSNGIPAYIVPQTSMTPIKVQNEGRVFSKRERVCEDESDADAPYYPKAARPRSARISSRPTRKKEEEAPVSDSSTSTSCSSASSALAVPSPGAHMSCALAGRAGSCKTTILQCCKFNSKHTQHSCKGQLSIVTHKRGHLAVSCSTRHQWVWCPLCCTCNAGKGAVADGKRGCAVSTHWYERDAFDTGARNHMNTHASVSK
jgi:hypothetical protein